MIALVVFAPTGLAQTGTELTQAQLEYNNKGVILINAGKFDEALGYFQSSLAIGEANVTYLNLGRTFTRMGRCADAAAAFEKVESAPKVDSPPPVAIRKILTRYRADLESECSAKIRFQCPDTDVAVAIDDAPAIACPNTPVLVQPGEHRVRISSSGQQSLHTVEVRAGEVSEVTVDAPKVQDSVGEIDTTGSSVMRTTALFCSLGGGALLAAGLVVDQTVVGSRLEDAHAASVNGNRRTYAARKDDFEAARNANRVVLLAGGGLAATGAVLWLLLSESSSESTVRASVSARDGGTSLELTWRW